MTSFVKIQDETDCEAEGGAIYRTGSYEYALKTDVGNYSTAIPHKKADRYCHSKRRSCICALHVSEGESVFCRKKVEDSFVNIVAKYVEMNVAHPFYEGNGRSTRIRFDLILKKNLGKCVGWSKIEKRGYLAAMKKSPVDANGIFRFISDAMKTKIDGREIFMKRDRFLV